MLILQFLISIILYAGFECGSCNRLSFGDNKIACVCNETYCDDLAVLSNFAPNQAAHYETNKDGARFSASLANFTSTFDSEKSLKDAPVLSIDRTQTYQFILGFGGAFTDSAGINIKSLTPKLQKILMSSYYSQNGLQYNMGRIPIASCDFSTHAYSYDDVKDDFNLTNFKLAKEDFLYKIPYIQLAKSLSETEVLFFASPWSPPAWMKTNGAMNGRGGIKGNAGGQYYKAYANYLVRFLESYKSHNITLWGMTIQNEPNDGCIEDFPFQALCFPPDQQRDFLKHDLGPALTKAGLSPDQLKIMLGDDMRGTLPKIVDKILEDPVSAQYVSGIAFHWYYEDFNPHQLLSITHKKYPSMFLLATEACTAYMPWDLPKADLGNWNRAERYAHDIIQDLLNWSVGWVDWNLALDMQGGPNWVHNYVDAPVIVNVVKNEFYKQPMYYVMAHFSKLLPRGSYRIGLNLPDSFNSFFSTFDIGAFQTPQDQIVVIAVNRRDTAVPIVLHDSAKGFLNVTVSPHSVHSYVW